MGSAKDLRKRIFYSRRMAVRRKRNLDHQPYMRDILFVRKPLKKFQLNLDNTSTVNFLDPVVLHEIHHSKSQPVCDGRTAMHLILKSFLKVCGTLALATVAPFLDGIIC